MTTQETTHTKGPEHAICDDCGQARSGVKIVSVRHATDVTVGLCPDCRDDHRNAGETVTDAGATATGALAEIVRRVNTWPALLAACEAAKRRYGSMWFGNSGKSECIELTSTRDEWNMLCAAIADARGNA